LWSPRYNSHRPVAHKKRPRLDHRCFRLLCSPIPHPHTGIGLTATLAAAHTDVAGSAPPRLGPRPASTPSALGESLHPERRRRRPPSRCPAAIRTSPQSAPCTGPRAPPGPLPVSLNNEQACGGSSAPQTDPSCTRWFPANRHGPRQSETRGRTLWCRFLPPPAAALVLILQFAILPPASSATRTLPEKWECGPNLSLVR